MADDALRAERDALAEVATAVLAWWDEHWTDTCGDYGEYNLYDTGPPQMVRLAEAWRATWGGR